MKQFDPAAFVELIKNRAESEGYTCGYVPHTEDTTGHVWINEANYTHVIAMTTKDGEWLAVNESPNLALSHIANVARRVAYTRITGKFTPTTEKD